ncbi:hypothetical protein GOC54_28125 [Sinorhizobium meliloti]|nr:hypothetical protein [Sinorhizobium meliloti]MDX0314896.1 hypothetical protein [Sinorhizobium meliloti]
MRANLLNSLFIDTRVMREILQRIEASQRRRAVAAFIPLPLRVQCAQTPFEAVPWMEQGNCAPAVW